MIVHCWSVLCNRSLIDKETNNVTLIDVLEQFQFQIKGDLTPPLPWSMELVTLWSRDNLDQKEKRAARVTFFSPSNKVIADVIPYQVDLTVYRRNRSRLRIEGLPPLKESGQYYFLIELEGDFEDKWTEVTRIPVDVLITKIEETAPTNNP